MQKTVTPLKGGGTVHGMSPLASPSARSIMIRRQRQLKRGGGVAAETCVSDQRRWMGKHGRVSAAAGGLGALPSTPQPA